MKSKRILSFFLSLMMIFGMLPTAASAEASVLSWNGGTITLAPGTTVGSYTLTTLSIYKQGATSTFPAIANVTQDGATINITLAEGTDPSYPIQMGFSGNGGYVQNSGNTCKLKNGKGTATVTLQAKPVAAPNAPVVGTGTFTVNFTVEMGEVFAVTPPTGEGFTFDGEATAGKNQDYSFTIAVNEGYDESNMVVKVNDEVTEGDNGRYTVSNVTEELIITVEGIIKKEVCNITAPTGEGFTFTGDATCYKGESYTFKITIDNAYTAADMTVKANGAELSGENGVYIIEAVNEDTAITVTGIDKKSTYTVTLTEGTGYTLSGQSTSYAGEPYEFSVTVDDAIYKAEDIIVKIDGQTVILENGKYTIPQLDADKTVTVENVIERELFTVIKPEIEGVTVSGGTAVREGKPYTFTVSVDNAYDSTDMTVKVNGEEATLINGCYTVTAAAGDIEITIEGITKKVVYSITKPDAEDFGFTGAETVYKGEDYSFTIAPKAGYIAVVKVNGEILEGSSNNYTVVDVSCDLVITATWEKAPLPEKELPVEDSVIDITDNRFAAYFSNKYYATATEIRVEGVKVSEAYEDGTTVYLILPYDTADDATAAVSITTSTNKYTVSGNTGSIGLKEGEAQLILTLTGKYNNMNTGVGSVTYTLIFFRELPPSEVPACIVDTDTAEAWRGHLLSIDLSNYFTGAQQYYLIDGNNEIPVDGKIYSYTPAKAGEQTLIFSAGNEIGRSEKTLTVTVNVKDVESGIYIGHTTSNGSLNYVYFVDENGNLIEGVDATYANKEITVILPKTYPVDGKIKAIYNLSQNDGGYPFLSTTTDKVGASPATKNKFTEKQTALSKGAASFRFYYFNSAPTGSNHEIFDLTYKIKNDKPALSDGISPTSNATITAGENYTLDLSPLFTDIDEDLLTYKVSVNGASPVEADANYTFTTDVAGTYTLVFTANDSKDDSADTYTVTLTVENSEKTDSMTVCVPDGLTPSFYVASGFEDGIDKLGDALDSIKGESSDGMTTYTVNYPVNAEMISVRTEDFGGMAFNAEKDGTVHFRKTQFKVVDYDNNNAVSTNNVTYSGNTAVAGSDGWLLVAGNEYVFTASPQNTDLTAASKTLPMEAGADIYIASIMLGIKNPMSITVPTGAKAQLYKYNQYYSNTEIDAKIITENGDGTSTFQFIADTKNGTFIYRVSMDGKITKAGWTQWGKQNITVTYTENDKEPSYRLDDYSATGESNSTITEDSVLLNINSRNHLNLSVGESKTLKAYRAWEIIPVSYNNYIIPPDFNFTILSGNDVVSLTEKPSASACDGDWMTLTALKEGIAIVEVTYDAIQISGGSYDGVYGASDPARSGLLVVQVGENDDSSVKFGIESFASIGTSGSKNITYNPNKQKDWDSEFDTLYFLGNSGNLTLKPTASSEITEVSVSHDKGLTWKTLSGENGVYTAEIISGNNILRVKTQSGTAYQVVRGDKITVKFDEVSDKSNDNGIIEAGETIRVHLNGLHNPIPKMAGNYNPGYSGNYDGYSSQHLNYTCNGNAIYGTGAQYNFITAANFVEVVMPDDGSNITLCDGYIGLGVVGLTTFFDGGDSHRNIPDGGCTTRGNETTYHTRSILPEITVSVGDTSAPNSAPIVRTDAVSEGEIYSDQNFAINPDTLFVDPDDDTMTFTVSVNGEEAVEAPLDYKFVPNGTGTYTLLFIATDGKETVQHTITLAVTQRSSQDSSDSEDDDFELSESETKGYVTISFVDKGVRVAGESGLKFPTPLGTIIKSTKVPYKQGEKISHVTKRLLDSLGIRMEYTGTLESGFYLGAICNFELKGTPYKSMGEFDAGVGSGWMITLNKKFIGRGASEFEVENGDVIKWQYTCQLGADIGDPFYSDRNNKTEEKKQEETEEKKEDNEKATFTETTFADVKKDDWHYESVKYVYENNLMQGTGGGFEPESKMSRAMLVTVLYRMANPENSDNKHTFADVPEGQWYTDAVNWAASSGIVNGISQSEFAPDSDISREQMALIIYRFAKMQGYNVSDVADISSFADVDDVSDWALDALCWANKTELVNGTSETTLSPKATATRAQIAAILMRFCENVAK